MYNYGFHSGVFMEFLSVGMSESLCLYVFLCLFLGSFPSVSYSDVFVFILSYYIVLSPRSLFVF